MSDFLGALLVGLLVDGFMIDSKHINPGVGLYIWVWMEPILIYSIDGGALCSIGWVFNFLDYFVVSNSVPQTKRNSRSAFFYVLLGQTMTRKIFSNAYILS